MRKLCVPFAALLALSACEEEAPEAVSTETGGEAAGEILGGTISDDMIPLEELTSTSPPAEPLPSERSGPGAPAQASGSAEAEEEAEPETETAEPTGPITAGPSAPIPETPEAEPPIGRPAP